MSQDLQQNFLNVATTLAQKKGWSAEILQQSCIEINLNQYHYLNWFPGAVSDVLLFLENSYDQEMLQTLASSPEIHGVTAKIAFALKTRIYGTTRSKILAIKNSNYYLLPPNCPQALKSAWRTVDLIWQYGGDDSVDFNYYSKRTLLYGVYLTAQTYYNLDNSSNNANTSDFIDKRLNQIVISAKCIKKVPRLLKKIPLLRVLL